MADNIDGIATPEKVAPVSVEPNNTTPQTSSDTDRGIEGRIKGLTAERDRHRDAAAETERKYRELVEKTKSEDDKRLDEMVAQKVDSEYGERLQRLDRIEKKLAEKRDLLLESIPEDHRTMVDDGASVDKQIDQAEGVLRLLKIEKKPSFDGGGPTRNPSEPNEYSWGEWQAFVDLAKTDPKSYREIREEMQAAYQEGRVDIPHRGAEANKPKQKSSSEKRRELLARLGR